MTIDAIASTQDICPIANDRFPITVNKLDSNCIQAIAILEIICVSQRSSASNLRSMYRSNIYMVK
ncbi:hypothetical protein [Microcoleus sp. herbarium12]|jgi:hypothetical protein|uniref:hypothetical protein n=1 Tax=Microcoleus sp. herbarium12 TaxID=3055437 RepID=UPI002FD2C545